MRQPDAERIRDMSARLIRPLDGDSEVFGEYGGVGLPWDRTGVGQPFDDSSWRETRSATWVMCWSDLMMTMFILFAAMYAFQVPKDMPLVFVETNKPESRRILYSTPPEVVDGILAGMHDKVRDVIERMHAGEFIRVSVAADESLHVSVDVDHVFQAESLQLSDEGMMILRDLGHLLQPLAYAWAVTGHAGSWEVFPWASDPWQVAGQRAMAVARFMRIDCGVSTERLSVVAFGDTRALSGEDQSGMRDKKVCIEIVIMKSNPAEPVPAIEPSEHDGFAHWFMQTGEGTP